MSNNTKSLNEFLGKTDSSNTEIIALPSNNLGHFTLTTRVPFYEFFRISAVANERSVSGEKVAQRKLDLKHAASLARYILKSLLLNIKSEEKLYGEEKEALEALVKIVGEQSYSALQPIVTNLRSAGINGCNLKAQELKTDRQEPIGLRVWLSQSDILYVVDGQHRRYAMQMIIEFLENIKSDHRYPPKKNSLFPHNREERAIPQDELNIWYECMNFLKSRFSIALEIHLGLGIEQERQLFHDLNNLGKKVEKSMALEFDSSNPVNQFIKTELIGTGLVQLAEGDKTDWNNDKGAFTRKEIVGINSHLVLNKTNITTATPGIVEARKDRAIEFWNIIDQIEGFGEEHSKLKTVAAQPVMLKALAKLTYDFAFGKFKHKDNLNVLVDGIPKIDFSHDNPLWRYYQLTDEEISKYELESLKDYLPNIEKGNRDIGHHDGAHMRFGSKHNDIFPILGDFIRWRLKLPSRHKK